MGRPVTAPSGDTPPSAVTMLPAGEAAVGERCLGHLWQHFYWRKRTEMCVNVFQWDS